VHRTGGHACEQGVASDPRRAVTPEKTVDDALSFDAPAPRVLGRSPVEALSWPMVRPVPSAARPAAGRGYTGFSQLS